PASRALVEASPVGVPARLPVMPACVRAASAAAIGLTPVSPRAPPSRAWVWASAAGVAAARAAAISALIWSAADRAGAPCGIDAEAAAPASAAPRAAAISALIWSAADRAGAPCGIDAQTAGDPRLRACGIGRGRRIDGALAEGAALASLGRAVSSWGASQAAGDPRLRACGIGRCGGVDGGRALGL